MLCAFIYMYYVYPDSCFTWWKGIFYPGDMSESTKQCSLYFTIYLNFLLTKNIKSFFIQIYVKNKHHAPLSGANSDQRGMKWMISRQVHCTSSTSSRALQLLRKFVSLPFDCHLATTFEIWNAIRNNCGQWTLWRKKQHITDKQG